MHGPFSAADVVHNMLKRIIQMPVNNLQQLIKLKSLHKLNFVVAISKLYFNNMIICFSLRTSQTNAHST